MYSYLSSPTLVPTLVAIGIFQVSWVRKSDAHILTVDQFSFINDDRFFVITPANQEAESDEHVDGSPQGGAAPRRPHRRKLLPADAEDWSLHIRFGGRKRTP